MDDRARAELIEKYSGFILTAASKKTHRYITKHDDEWSVALEAFSEAITTFDGKRSGFFSFAKLVINRRLTDYYRSGQKYHPEFSCDPVVFTGENRDEQSIALPESILSDWKYEEARNIKEEIEGIQKTLSLYGFSFMDLTSSSPKAAKTKDACNKAIAYLAVNEQLLTRMRSTAKLPIEKLTVSTGIPRKLLERHRRYIIAASEILAGDYPRLSEYLNSIKKEMKK